MSNRRSSFRADAHAPSARRSAWPWLLGAGPALVIVASLATAWIAVTRNDAVVADDYYKLGLTINRRLAATPVATHAPGATIVIASDGGVRVSLRQAIPAQPVPMPAALRLTVQRPGARTGSGALTLARREDGDFAGTLTEIGAGKRIVTLESDAWRLPVTVVDGLPATITLGAPQS